MSINMRYWSHLDSFTALVDFLLEKWQLKSCIAASSWLTLGHTDSNSTNCPATGCWSDTNRVSKVRVSGQKPLHAKQQFFTVLTGLNRTAPARTYQQQRTVHDSSTFRSVLIACKFGSFVYRFRAWNFRPALKRWKYHNSGVRAMILCVYYS